MANIANNYKHPEPIAKEFEKLNKQITTLTAKQTSLSTVQDSITPSVAAYNSAMTMQENVLYIDSSENNIKIMIGGKVLKLTPTA